MLKFKSERIYGIFLALLAQISLFLMMFVAKILYNSTSIGVFEVAYWRATLTIIIILIYGTFVKAPLFTININYSFKYFVRVLFAGITMMANFLAVKLVNLTIYMVLAFLMPMYSILFAKVMLNDIIHRSYIIYIIISFVGVLIVAFAKSPSANSNEVPFAWVIPFLSGIGMSFGDTIHRQINSQIDFLAMTLSIVYCTSMFSPLIEFGLMQENSG